MGTVQVNGLQMRFGDFLALPDISVSVDEGEFVTLLGPSGCGKTTLLKLISGFLKPTAGTIHIAGKEVTHVPPETRDTAMCFQSYALFPHLSVRENLEFGLRQKRIAAAERDQRLDRVAEQLKLGPQLEKLPNQLSGGQQQRVALGRALIMRPTVILFDEPLSNLDAKLRDTVRMEIRRIQKDYNLTAIYVTHDQSEALALSDRVMIMNGGRIEQIASPEELYWSPRTSFVADFIGGANVLDAEVIGGKGEDHWVLSTPLGELVAASGTEPKSKKIKICWRPEVVQPDGNGPNRIETQISERSFQGSFTDLFFTAAEQTFRVQLPEPTVRSGENLAFSIRPQDIVMLESMQ
ncbi:ABC transporter ATP-binding protein [Nitratireductor sp. XY-223]|uniref:ABC transporter ATP-binding protein n=1 Tax=Nitratireductor sp. XY-223 TaxID=2561926 RepID=UPI0019806DD2|nr:ABC transporter ATP-binding protein [Nitratireductor sp. XY-223]